MLRKLTLAMTLVLIGLGVVFGRSAASSEPWIASTKPQSIITVSLTGIVDWHSAEIAHGHNAHEHVNGFRLDDPRYAADHREHVLDWQTAAHEGAARPTDLENNHEFATDHNLHGLCLDNSHWADHHQDLVVHLHRENSADHHEDHNA